jgi:hypothetical protein
MKAITDEMLRMLIIKELAAIDASVAEDLCTTTFVTKLFLAKTLHSIAITYMLD